MQNNFLIQHVGSVMDIYEGQREHFLEIYDLQTCVHLNSYLILFNIRERWHWHKCHNVLLLCLVTLLNTAHELQFHFIV